MTNLPETDAEHKLPSLQALNDAALAITSELDLGRVLDQIAQSARDLLEVRFAALGVPDGKGGLAQFHTAGMPHDQIDQMDHLPVGKGLLGLLLTDTQIVRIPDMALDPRSAGFCAYHPYMKTFLGAPILYKGQHLGNLYLCDRVDGNPFTVQNEQLIQLLASQAAIAIANAQLSEQLRRLAVLEERERISRELHDGIIQQIYAIGMRLELVKNLVHDPLLDPHLDATMKALNDVIDDVREYIRDLDSGLQRRLTLERALGEVIDAFHAISPARLDVTIQPIARPPEREQRHAIVQIAREALSNVARHSQATQVTLYLDASDEQYHLTIEDNGRGFDPASASAGNGLYNMQERARKVGGWLTIHSMPGQGTKLTLWVPYPER
ncbi:MAG TPA: GAF domain-containing sensor histidine kinase [Aggregatilineales bacterium]|nr:GAF domain-containing sensor histidine kinase [Aggregatilineales bacterium]